MAIIILLCYIADYGCRVPLVNRYVKLNFSSTLEGSVLILTCNEKLISTTNAADEQVLKVTCYSNITSWTPDPTDFIESCSSLYFTTSESIVPAGIKCPFSAHAWRQLGNKISFASFNDILNYFHKIYAETSPQTPVVNIMVLIIVTLIAVCVVSSIVFLSIGYACGLKHEQSRTSKASDSSVEENNPHQHKEGSQQLHPQTSTPGPLYEELQQRSTPEHQDLVELKENVAYGPIIKIIHGLAGD